MESGKVLPSLKDCHVIQRVGIFRKRSSGEVLLRLTYRAYVEDEEDETVKANYATGNNLDEDTLYFVQLDRARRGDLLAVLLVSEEF